tara:strand:+ start:1262 stop:2731 length:1470 start_codon:yes stop_codon:yes gene_type:complete
MANESIITGKTWDQMNNAEKSAHVIGRGESYNQPFFNMETGQAWLDSNIGDKKAQTELFVRARDAAADRIEDGTFNITDPNKISAAIRLAELAQPAFETPSEFGGVATTTPATLGVSTREPIDTSIYSSITAPNNAYSNELQVTGSWDNNQGYTLYNPETGQYESYAMPENVNGRNPFVPGNGVTSYYQTPDGNTVLGFNPSRAQTINDGDNGSIVVALPPNNPPTTPTNNLPVYVEPPGYGNVPPPTGDGTFVEGNPPPDTSWDWDYFRDKAVGDRQWGGYDVDYQAFERYQPGMDSPWGMPNIEGNNNDFYQQQFVNLLRDEQGFDARQREAQRRQQEAYENPYEAIEMDWSWANNGQGLPEIVMGTGVQAEKQYNLSNNFSTDSSNIDVLNQLRGLDSFDNESDQQNFDNWLSPFEGQEQWANDNTWANWADKESFSNTQGGNQSPFLGRVWGNIYNLQPSGPTTPVGYAQPYGFGPNYNASTTGG